MKSDFREYFPLNADEYKEIWQDGIIVLDTNVLLRIFRYKDKTAKNFIGMLRSISSRLWLPKQVAWEFHRRRYVKIEEAKRHYVDIIKCFQECEKVVVAKINSTSDFCIDPVSNVDVKVKSLIDAITNGIKEIENEYSADSVKEYYDELFFDIADLCEGKIGKGFTDKELGEVFKEGSERYKNSIPPGFADLKTKKDNDHQELYGDLIIWKEIIRESKERGLPVLFVTEDTKEDWWEGGRGKTIGPLPALRKEFFVETGQLFHMYRVRTFIDQAGRMLNLRMDRESTNEINNANREDEREAHSFSADYKKYLEYFSPYRDIPKKSHASQLLFLEVLNDLEKINYDQSSVFEAHKKNTMEKLFAAQKAKEQFELMSEELLKNNGYDYTDPEMSLFSRKIESLDREINHLVRSLNLIGVDEKDFL